VSVANSDQGHALRALHLRRLAGARLTTAPHHTAARLTEKAGEKIFRLFFDTLPDPPVPFDSGRVSWHLEFVNPEGGLAFEGTIVRKNAMNIKLSCGSELLITDWPAETPPTVAQLLAAAGTTRPAVVATWCDEQARLRESLPIFINGEHIRYRQGLQTELKDGDEVYVIPLIAGG
jgi:sulfur-carrier protein